MSNNEELKIRKDEWLKMVICMIIGFIVLYAIFGPHQIKSSKATMLNEASKMIE